MNAALRPAAVAAALSLWLLAPAAPAAGDDGPAKKPASPAPSSVKPPVDMDGVLLDDGRQIEGKYDEKAGQHWVIHPKAGGADVEVSVTQVVIAEKGDFVDVKGDDSAAVKVWKAAAQTAYAAKTSESEAAAKAAQYAVLDKGVEWCKHRDFVTAPTALVNEMARVDPSKAAELEARAKSLVPKAFFFKDAPDAAKQWMIWADALLPSSAEFVGTGEDDPDDTWKRLRWEPWTDGKTLLFRTKNSIMFIRDMDPSVCGKALRMAETTCRALQYFLHDGEPDPVSSDVNRLEIRIHKSRKDYLDEVPLDPDGKPGKKAEPWTAGFFNPRDGISHFYVDRRGTSVADIEELTRVLTHEFTHHYMDVRWMQGQSGGGQGFWVVEGMAEFVQNQSHHPERGIRFDDDHVTGVVDTAMARRAGVTSKYLEMSEFVDMSQTGFQALSDGPLGRSGMSERGLWYDQAGALCYFFLQKKGAEMRKKFVQYVYDHYRHVSHVPAWEFLGYKSAAELDQDFGAFLATVVK